MSANYGENQPTFPMTLTIYDSLIKYLKNKNF